MSKKSIDNKLLSALALMSAKERPGIHYLEFVKQGTMSGALDLIEKGHAKKFQRYQDDPETSYYLTPKGKKYLNRIMKVAKLLF